MWELIIHLWKHRNKQVHDREGKSIHTIEQEDLDKAITHEWDKGINNLPDQYDNLFQNNIEQRLSNTIDRKRQWLASVWTARERQNGNYRFHNTANTALHHIFENDSE